MQRYRPFLIILLGCSLLILVGLTVIIPAQAAKPDNTPLEGNPALQITDEPAGVRNADCLICHGAPGQTHTFPSGEILDLTVNAEDFNKSIHGSTGYACVQCHTDIREYPHPANTAQTLREMTLQMNESCASCHAVFFDKTRHSVHAAASDAGMEQAAVCVDCHGAHDIRRLTDPDTRKLLEENRTWIAATCSKCHNAIYQKYATSVHGSALFNNNTDVPTCIDCHGVHNIEDPRTAQFRLKSPSICAKCHINEEIMARYGISTYVLTSYVADFHGTTVTLFEKQTPDHQTNKAVCYDCHGIHDISSTRDPRAGLHIQENLLVRCQECHPDATANFPTAWLSHYEPSPGKFPAVFYVNLFYKFFIPVMVGGMGVLVLMDFGRKMIDQTRKFKKISAGGAEELIKSGQIGQVAANTANSNLSADKEPHHE